MNSSKIPVTGQIPVRSTRPVTGQLPVTGTVTRNFGTLKCRSKKCGFPHIPQLIVRSLPRSATVTVPYLPAFLRRESVGKWGDNGCFFTKPGCRNQKRGESGAVEGPDRSVSQSPPDSDGARLPKTHLYISADPDY